MASRDCNCFAASVLLALVTGFGGSPASAANVSPRAMGLIADGSSSTQSIDSEVWFSLDIEPGKTYVIDAFQPYTTPSVQSLRGLSVWDSDGTSPAPETTSSCNLFTGTDPSTIAPSLSAASGYRCVVRSFSPFPSNTLDRRSIYIRVSAVSFPPGSFQIRAYESTIYGRWTTNGYDFHIEVQNTTGTQLCAQALLFRSSGSAYNGPAPMNAGGADFSIPAYGAYTLVVPAGTMVNGENRGTLRINGCAGAENLVGNALHVSTYAFNPVTKQFLYFFPWKANGVNGNSF